MRHAVRRLAHLAAFLALATSASAQAAGPAGPAEHLIKAGYIYNFAKLVEWPAAALRPGHPMVIGVLGNDAFAAVLQRVIEGKKIDDRPFVVKRLKDNEFRGCGCQILFVAAEEAGRADEIVQFQRTASVLTIADAPDFARRGGMIAFTLEDSKVRFIVNQEAAEQASLNISSRLLALATIVRTSR